jgi:hypothetical protein
MPVVASMPGSPHLLQFEYPLKRIRPISELDGTPQDQMQQYVRGSVEDISNIFACQTTYNEALAVFYELNTVSLSHHDICLMRQPMRGSSGCDVALAQHVLFVDWAETGPWTKCRRCRYRVVEFLNTLNKVSFPKLKSLTIDLEGFPGGHEALREQMLKTLSAAIQADISVKFAFTAIGCFNLTSPHSSVALKFR